MGRLSATECTYLPTYSEHPRKKRIRTGTSGGRKPWTGTSGEEAALDWSVRG